MLALALGDPTGIGPEVTLKAVASEMAEQGGRYLLVGDSQLVRDLNARFQIGLEIEDAAPHSSAAVQMINPTTPLSRNVQAGSPEAARAALAYLKHGAELCLRGVAAALVTAPVNKEAIIRSGETNFVGQTELLSAMANTDRTAMMLLGADDRGRWLRVALATIHVPIREVASKLSREKIELAIELAATACRDLGLPRARVAVCGLNPHAGEGGKIGDEEITLIAPAVAAMQA